MQKDTLKNYLILNILFAIMSFSAVFSKFASQCDFLSIRYCFFQAGMVFMLAIYAIGWQQIIKRMPLATAYVNKAVSVVWGLFWGLVIFKEQLTPGKIAGALIVIAGVVLYAFSEEVKE
ncbi:MAG TPA: transporter [Bacillota bacterium]|nr:transporter [Bacillota bacterium]